MLSEPKDQGNNFSLFTVVVSASLSSFVAKLTPSEERMSNIKTLKLRGTILDIKILALVKKHFIFILKGVI